MIEDIEIEITSASTRKLAPHSFFTISPRQVSSASLLAIRGCRCTTGMFQGNEARWDVLHHEFEVQYIPGFLQEIVWEFSGGRNNWLWLMPKEYCWTFSTSCFHLLWLCPGLFVAEAFGCWGLKHHWLQISLPHPNLLTQIQATSCCFLSKCFCDRYVRDLEVGAKVCKQ